MLTLAIVCVFGSFLVRGAHCHYCISHSASLALNIQQITGGRVRL